MNTPLDHPDSCFVSARFDAVFSRRQSQWTPSGALVPIVEFPLPKSPCRQSFAAPAAARSFASDADCPNPNRCTFAGCHGACHPRPAA